MGADIIDVAMFEHYLSERSNWPNARLVSLSLAAHVIALGGVLWVAGIFSVEELEPPPLQVTLFPSSEKISAAPAAGSVIHGETIAPRIPRPKPKDARVLESPSTQPIRGAIFANVDRAEPDPDPNQSGVPQETGGDTLLDVPASSQRGAGGLLDGTQLDSERLLYPDPHLPEEFTSQHPQETIVATYRMCIRTNGSISAVTPIKGVTEIDRVVMHQLKTSWLYRPRAFPICVARRFVFLID